MILFRWMILRLFWSLLLLPLAAFPLLWLLHEVAFPGVYFQDTFIVVLVWSLLFAAASLILNRIGVRRFTRLDTAGRAALEKNQEENIKTVFELIGSLFAGGLLSRNFQEKMQRQLLRHYFPFYAAHPEKEWHREQLLASLRKKIRAEECYEILKTYVIQQPALTLSIIDLADELLEHRPDDEALLVFLTRQYLQERKTHHRAEHIFKKSLAKGGPMVPQIVSLCLERLLRGERRDDFAVWTYVRAFAHGQAENSPIRKQLYEAQKFYHLLGRQDSLAEAVREIAATFTENEIADWAMEQRAEQAKTLHFRIARVVFHVQQKLLAIFSWLREQRRWAYAMAGVMFVLGLGYLLISDDNSQTATVSNPAPTEIEDSTAVYFTLQVSATRNASNAQREAEQLRNRGLEVHVLTPQTSRGWHRVRVGKYRSRHTAQLAADSLKTLGIIHDYFIANFEKQ